MPLSVLYTSLDPNEIRLICLQPGNTDSIVCDLKRASLLESPSYEALSYTWELDDPTPDKHLFSITLSGRTFSVAANLYSALTHLRQNEPRILWIDAICINQDDLLERAQQVRIMSKIYSSASRVLIWLGEEEPTDKLAFDNLRDWNERLKSPEVASNLSAHVWKVDLAELDTPAWTGLGSVLSRRWFRRLWVIQEAVMAEKAIVICGSQTVDWEVLETVLYHFYKNSMHGFFSVNARGESGPVAGTTVTRIRSVKEGITSGNRLSLLQLLLYTTNLDCTDARDILYGLLSLAAADALEIPVNYSIPVQELFAHINREMIDNDDELRLLSFFDAPSLEKPILGTPWAPNWQFRDNRRTGFFQFPNNFDAMSLDTNRPSFSRDGPKLKTLGVIFDVPLQIGMVGCASYLDKDGTQLKFSHDVMTFIESCGAVAAGPTVLYDPPQTLQEATWRTMICNTAIGGEVVPSSYGYKFNTFKFFMRAAQYPDLMAIIPDHQREMRCREANEFQLVLDRWIHGRVFCRTKNGYLGMLPVGSRPGDEICGILRAKTPYVIRKKPDGCYQLIGECYIHGMMNGELFHLPNLRARIQDIVLA
ncbi:heterokaryon incompatibility protein-domain-containing protein [Cadophora sp. MPI-SDFR-AT-0126]|nr:heterokaryon incompatibility protein-domain-containing protein [Leotiomycetes sp. MPI-SDFR-AT-0126]